jgi:ankyrin repeat protein
MQSEFGRETALHCAAEQGHLNVVKLLLEAGASYVTALDIGKGVGSKKKKTTSFPYEHPYS